jgi:hypothetical protein
MNRPCAEFLNKVLTGLGTGRTESTFNPTKNDFSINIRLTAMITMNTEVVGIVKSAFMVPVTDPSGANLLGYLQIKRAISLKDFPSFKKF